ncbi:SAM-dependent methyltransferase [Altererythrobacter sp.]|uniref:class I SAM-dependent methyltransferase n=1 Tax=Altererythrobacter sp. TaxID=1872480 RepID=UPI003D05D8F5
MKVAAAKTADKKPAEAKKPAPAKPQAKVVEAKAPAPAIAEPKKAEPKKDGAKPGAPPATEAAKPASKKPESPKPEPRPEPPKPAAKKAEPPKPATPKPEPKPVEVKKVEAKKPDSSKEAPKKAEAAKVEPAKPQVKAAAAKKADAKKPEQPKAPEAKKPEPKQVEAKKPAAPKAEPKGVAVEKDAPPRPDAKQAQGEKSEAAKAQPKDVEAKKSEPSKPEPEKAKAEKVEPPRQESKKPEAKPAAAAEPEPAKPELKQPEPKQSEAKKTEAKKPEPKPAPPPKPVEDPVKRFRRLIRETGPISLAQFMAESNALYYSTRDPLGEEGDFITAPEVSQMFGELIGLWMADVWVKAGRPDPVYFVELGPGRGTLAQDALRTAARYELMPQVHFVEASPTLREAQLKAVPDAIHHDDVTSLPTDGPLLLVANEFFDALPIHQLIRSAQGWHERMIGLDGDRFVFVGGDKPMDSIVPSSWRTARQGTMVESSPASAAIISDLSDRLVAQGGAGLVIDYGPRELRSGSTIQAIRAHKKIDIFDAPGESDITAHVDFEMLGKVVERQGARVMGVEMQGDWLTALGIETRTEALQRRSPDKKDVIDRQLNRLIAEDQMGLLFKVMGIASPEWPMGVGFDD